MLLLAVLLVVLWLPPTRRSLPMRALRAVVKPLLPTVGPHERWALRVRRLIGWLVTLLGLGAFAYNGGLAAAAGYFLAIGGVLLYVI
ncbi:hypothetical protein ACFC58_06755 [Kitasatospora purpeofusca]|uniref:hypothetical protein n=1 Tax=Kitasatospora purpeofusca TaxID=67352 RepID=UPI0035D92627